MLLKRGVEMMIEVGGGSSRRRINCCKCLYQWNTRSSMRYITCPNCMGKTKNENGD